MVYQCEFGLSYFGDSMLEGRSKIKIVAATAKLPVILDL